MEQTPLQGLEEKLQQLLRRYERLQNENQKLKSELENTQTQLAKTNLSIKALEQQNDALKVGVQHWNIEEKKVLQRRIDGYLKDIETCLALLDA
ncbi:hypothetical protein [Arachidicoccus sp.]|jgi:chromosome segregation ATPase|uniref:hypothetical protein n=1 Tax=Arachidicoccus sp. TaxID=1872624 RepID=UPI003D251D20